MSQLVLGTSTIVGSTSPAFNYGEVRFDGGAVRDEIYQRDPAGTNGVYEIESGRRERLIPVQCTWHSNNEYALEQFIEQLHASRVYHTLSIATGAGVFPLTYFYCRLATWRPSGPREYGVLDGENCTVVRKVLIFKQIRTGAQT